MFKKKSKNKVERYLEYEESQSSNNQPTISTNNIKAILGISNDVVIKDVYVNGNKNLPATIMFIDGLVSQDKISEFILQPLSESELFKQATNDKDVINQIMAGAVYYSTAKLLDQMDNVINAMLSGHALLIFNSLNKAIAFETKGYDKRNIGPATEESSYKGSKVTFLEDIRSNTSIMRLQIKSPNLTVEDMVIGRQSNTTVSILYMRNICKEDFVTQIKKRLNTINADKALALTDISSYIVENKYTPFPQVQVTEKPDAVSASLLEGKVAIIIDSIPYAIVLPIVINDIFQAPSDYGMHFVIASLFRIIRYTLFFIALLLPGFYIALTEFHNAMIPKALAFAIASSAVDTPFSISLEVILMVLAFFTLIEASIRIPINIGNTISIVGGLVLGEAAITAKLVSPAVIVIVATSAIASMSIPNKDMNFAVWLFLLLNSLLSSSLGLFGLTIGFLIMLYHLATLEVLGVPYLSPFAGASKVQLQDSFIRFPTSLLRLRPNYLQPKNKRKHF